MRRASTVSNPLGCAANDNSCKQWAEVKSHNGVQRCSHGFVCEVIGGHRNLPHKVTLAATPPQAWTPLSNGHMLCNFANAERPL